MPKTVARSLISTDFPLYSVACFGGQHFIVAGGGGAAKTGIPNAIEAFEISNLSRFRCESESLNRTLTDDLVQDSNEAIMNGSVSHWKIKSRSVYYATGMNNKCTVFEVFKEPNKTAQCKGSVEVCEASDGYQTAVGWLHDDSLIVCADSSGHLSAWKFPEMTLKFRVQLHKTEIESLALSPIGSTAVTCGRDGSMKEVNLEKGELENDLFWTAEETLLKSYRCRACCYAVVNHDRSKVKLYSVHIPKVLKNKQKSPLFLVKWDNRLLPERKAVMQSTGTPSCLASSIDGNFLGVGSLEGSVSIYISFSLRCVKRVENAHSSFVTGLVFAPVTFFEASGKDVGVMQSRMFADFDAVLLSISIDKEVNCIALPQRTSCSVGVALLFCVCAVMLVGLGIAFASVVEL